MSAQPAPILTEQRLVRPDGESAAEFLRDFPALLALSRLPVPILAVDDMGTIEFANEAFATMVGRAPEELLAMTAQSLIDCFIAPPSRGVVAALRAHANTVLRLRHADGWTMPALVSDSVLIRDDETLAVITVTDLSEIAWSTSPDDELLPG